MALFNRKKKDSVLPEIDKYYDGERRDRAGLAWLLALVSVIVVTLIVVGLFAGGRWAYRELTDNDDVALVQEGDEEIIPDFDGAASPSEGDETPAPSDEENDDQTPEDSEETPAEEEGRVDAPARTDTPSDPVAQVPATGDNPLPSTGPANIVSIFAGVTTLAGGAHFAITRKRMTSKK